MISNIGIWVGIVHFMFMIIETRLEHTNLKWSVVFSWPWSSYWSTWFWGLWWGVCHLGVCCRVPEVLFEVHSGKLQCVRCRVCTFCFVCWGRWCICLCCIWLWWGLSACLHIVCGVVGMMFCVAPVWSRSTFLGCTAQLYRNMVWPQNSGSILIWFRSHRSFAARQIEGSRWGRPRHIQYFFNI